MVGFVIEIKGTITSREVRDIFDHKQDFFMRKDLLVQKLLEFLFIDSLILFDESDIFDPQLMENLLGNLQLLEVRKTQDKMFLGHESLKEVLDEDITHVIFFGILQCGEMKISSLRFHRSRRRRYFLERREFDGRRGFDLRNHENLGEDRSILNKELCKIGIALTELRKRIYEIHIQCQRMFGIE